MTSADPYRSTAFWYHTAGLLAPQIIYEEGGRTNGLNIRIENGAITTAAWVRADGNRMLANHGQYLASCCL